MEILYHGTDRHSAEDIVKNGINVHINPRPGDFGTGFYLTPVLRRAQNWALRRTFSMGEPGVIEMVMVRDFKKHLSVKEFFQQDRTASDAEKTAWAQFIINNRCGMEYIRTVSLNSDLSDHNLDLKYDMVIGRIADGDVVRISRECRAQKRLITLREADNFLENDYGMQYCINTERALAFIDKQPRIKKGVLWR